jgi:hypothetical protein
MKIPNLTPLQEKFLHIFATGASFPDTVVALRIDPRTLALWRSQPAFTLAHFRACHDHFRHKCDLLQIEEIRSYLARPILGPAPNPEA